MKSLTEKEAEDFLEKKGFNVIPRAVIINVNELKKLESKIKFPWVMKVSSKKIAHKAKVGGIYLNINNIEKANEAFNKIKQIPGFEGALIQPMIKGEELIIGIKKTPEFAQVLMFGKGGSKVEQEKDISFRVIPIKEKDAREMIKETKIYKSIKSKINEKIIVRNLIKFSKLAKSNRKITELDINPMMVNKKEATIVDARLQLE
jgi:acyl-CoA synthetase (NDP forming)